MGRLTASEYGAPWHAESYDRLLDETLPGLLARRLPLRQYAVERTTPGSARVRLAVGAGSTASATYELPAPVLDGTLELAGARRVVVPTASGIDLAGAEIRCIGEQVLSYIERRLGEAPEELPWDDALLGAWLPLERWLREFLLREPTAQVVDGTNWLSHHTHLRRLLVLGEKPGVHASHVGRVCPVEAPEGPNCGKVFTIALGARIDGCRLLPTTEPGGLGLAASLAPLLEHTDPIRALMGANMMRQWLPPEVPEPADVRTGREPDEPGVWCGRSLLTAYMPFGGDTFEDAIVVSESCAARLGYPAPLEPGDKLSNRHGQKGVISRIVPDSEMPTMADGTPVDLVYSSIALHTRLNFGQVREAVLGRVARAAGAPFTAPPFEAPSADALRGLLCSHGLPEDGMEQLTLGRGGPALRYRTTVGWVYWGKTCHLAGGKLHFSVREPDRAQGHSALEYAAMRDAGGYANVADCFLRDVRSGHAEGLADRIARGETVGPTGSTAQFEDLVRRLAAAGVAVDRTPAGLRFRFAEPSGDVIRLARPVAHPWLRERQVAAIGRIAGVGGLREVEEANERLGRLLEGDAPARLREQAEEELEERVRSLFRSLLTRDHTQPNGRCLFTGRAVLAPGHELRHDEVGLPEDLAWGLFGPLVTARVGDPTAVEARSEAARAALSELMAESWVLVNRAPAVETTNVLAFRPKVVAGRAIRLVPLACRLMNADHDGDQAAVYLPITAEAQAEAPQRLSVAGQLLCRPRPSLYPGAPGLSFPEDLCPWCEAGWGLVELGRTAEGRAEIERQAGTPVDTSEGTVTRGDIARAMGTVLSRDGAEAMLDAIDRLWRLGFEASRLSGASLSPFVGEGPRTPRPAESDDARAWRAYADELIEEIRSRTDYDDPLLGSRLALVRTRTRGNATQLGRLVGVADARDPSMPVRHGYYHGLTVEEYLRMAAAGRQSLCDNNETWAGVIRSLVEEFSPAGLNVLSRAWCARRPWSGARSPRPGVVFARAAAIEEVDPLTDIDSRLFVGLPVEETR